MILLAYTIRLVYITSTVITVQLVVNVLHAIGSDLCAVHVLVCYINCYHYSPA